MLDHTPDAQNRVKCLEAMLSTVNECFKIVDREGRLIDMNATGLHLIEAESLDDVRGVSVLELIDAEYHDLFLEGLRNALSGERVTQEFQITGLLGTKRWMQQIAVALPSPDDSPPEYVGAFTRDVSETRHALEALREARDRAESANRSKSQFLANMSHEIRTPMNAILGHIELLAPDGPGLTPTQQTESFDTIQRSATHLLSLIDDVLDVSKIDAGSLSVESVPTMVTETIASAVELLRPAAAAKSLTLSLSMSPDVPACVLTDPTRFKQALINLLGNAIKFTNEGGVEILVSFDGDSSQLGVAVRDSGIGMDADQLKRIRRFEAFAQADASTSRSFGGTGLGLKISSEIARLLGGSIVVDSQPGVGSTFTLRLAARPVSAWAPGPRVDHSETRDSAPSAPAGTPRLDGVHVLVVEDGVDNRKLLEFQLKGAGAGVSFASGGRTGVDLAMSLAGSTGPVLVLMDMQLPGMDGYEAASLLRARGSTLPVIAITAHAMAGDRERCLAAGCSDYLPKPIARDALLRACAHWARSGTRLAA